MARSLFSSCWPVVRSDWPSDEERYDALAYRLFCSQDPYSCESCCPPCRNNHVYLFQDDNKLVKTGDSLRASMQAAMMQSPCCMRHAVDGQSSIYFRT